MDFVLCRSSNFGLSEASLAELKEMIANAKRSSCNKTKVNLLFCWQFVTISVHSIYISVKYCIIKLCNCDFEVLRRVRGNAFKSLIQYLNQQPNFIIICMPSFLSLDAA